MTFITLLGNDITALTTMFAEFKDKIKKHIVVFDDAPSERFRLKQFQDGILKYSKSKGLNIEFFAIKIDEDSKEDMSKVIARVKELSGDEILLHTTQAYAATSLILSNLVLQVGAKVLSYDNREDEYHIYDGATLKAYKPNLKLNIDEYMQLLNYMVIEKHSPESLRSRRKDILKLFENFDAFRKVRLALMNADTTFDYAPYKSTMDSLFALGILDANHKLISAKTLDLGGTLFEEYILWLCEPLGFDDIAMGVKIDVDLYQNETQKQNRITNELDIVLMKNNTLFTIECKFSNNLDGLAFVYKYDAIMDYFGENVKGIILNISPKDKKPYLGMKESKNFRPSTLRRAKLSNLHVYHEKKVNPIAFTNFVKDFFC